MRISLSGFGKLVFVDAPGLSDNFQPFGKFDL